VVVWHFAHSETGYPVPFGQAPTIGLLDEGHCGVALFMCLSGYLFAKLIDGRKILFWSFLWNRALRLLPLLLLVIAVYGVLNRRADPASYLKMVIGGAILPQLPNGGWSITCEAHFYVLLPLLLWGSRQWKWAPLLVIGVAILFRVTLYGAGFDIKTLAYFTIIGRVDQFAIGVFFYSCRPPAWLAALLGAVLIGFYAWFDVHGGFYHFPNPAIWIAVPTIEALGFAAFVAWYDQRAFRNLWFLRKAGEYSYSIYLLHFFFVFGAADFVNRHVIRLTSTYAVIPWAILFFAFMTVLGHFSYVWIERPFLRFRTRYIKETARLSS
jgi:peptidoglycan/LPS O-acetylase OafA/YrhL